MPDTHFMDSLIIFNTIRGQLISTDARAFIRHAFGCFYRDFAMVDTHNKPFVWQHAFADTIRSYRSAVLAWAQSIRVFTTNRRHSHNKKKQVPKTTLEMFPWYAEVEQSDHCLNAPHDGT